MSPGRDMGEPPPSPKNAKARTRVMMDHMDRDYVSEGADGVGAMITRWLSRRTRVHDLKGAKPARHARRHQEELMPIESRYSMYCGRVSAVTMSIPVFMKSRVGARQP